MWLPLHSIKPINVDLIRSAASQSSSYPIALTRLGGLRSTFKMVELATIVLLYRSSVKDEYLCTYLTSVIHNKCCTIYETWISDVVHLVSNMMRHQSSRSEELHDVQRTHMALITMVTRIQFFFFISFSWWVTLWKSFKMAYHNLQL